MAEAAFNNWIAVNIYQQYAETDIDEIELGAGKVARHFPLSHTASGGRAGRI